MLLVFSKLDYHTREPRNYRDRRHLYLAWAFNLYVRFMRAFAQDDWSHAKDLGMCWTLSVPRTSQSSRANVDSLNRNFVLKLKKFLTRHFGRQRAFKNNHLVYSSNDCCNNNQRCALRTPHDIRCRLLQCLKFV
jgi:hypothetical protein